MIKTDKAVKIKRQRLGMNSRSLEKLKVMIIPIPMNDYQENMY